MRALKRLASFAALAAMIAAPHLRAAEATEPGGKHTGTVGKPQATCPVLGGKINKELYADVNGKRIYVCCGGCIAPIKKNPDTFIKKLEAEGVVLEKAPEGAKLDAHKGHSH